MEGCKERCNARYDRNPEKRQLPEIYSTATAGLTVEMIPQFYGDFTIVGFTLTRIISPFPASYVGEGYLVMLLDD